MTLSDEFVLGDEMVSLSEFQGIFLPCTEMTMDDVTQLFNIFASEPVPSDRMEYGSGLSGIDEDAYLYYEYYDREEPSLFNFIGPNEVKEIWEFLHTDISSLLRDFTGRCPGPLVN